MSFENDAQQKMEHRRLVFYETGVGRLRPFSNQKNRKFLNLPVGSYYCDEELKTIPRGKMDPIGVDRKLDEVDV